MKYKEFDYYFELSNKNDFDLVLQYIGVLKTQKLNTNTKDGYYIDVCSRWEAHELIRIFISEKKISCSYCHYEDEVLTWDKERFLDKLRIKLPEFIINETDDFLKVVITTKEAQFDFHIDFEEISDKIFMVKKYQNLDLEEFFLDKISNELISQNNGYSKK